MKRSTFNISVFSGNKRPDKRQVEGLVSTFMGIEKGTNTVSHLPTGLKIWDFQNVRTARQFINIVEMEISADVLAIENIEDTKKLSKALSPIIQRFKNGETNKP